MATMEDPIHADEPTSDEVRSVVAQCIAALEQGEADPVARLCHGRPRLEAQVQTKLQRLRGLDLLDAPRQEPTTAELLGTDVGPYRLVREIGRGGMGVVYLAEQTLPVERRVALKLIRRGLDTDESIARFRVEQRTLARMNHPGIAQVHDAGTTEDGRPYFVMEFVEGVPLERFVPRLDRTARLELFTKVCTAVQHAHDRGVIHRDLKPSNILITPDGAPKVIDFGIAKALEGQGEAALLTRRDQLLGTPEYMAPEQVRAGATDADVRCDVYSLGVILYQLVADALPFESERLRAAGFRELETILGEETPPPPSRRRSGSSRWSSTDREPDWIVMRAIAKAPDERYASVRSLADDVQRYLDGEPVDAGPPSGWYRTRKFVQRHRLQVTAATLVLASIAGGAAGSFRYAVLASAHAEETERALDGVRSSFQLALGAVEELLVHASELDALDRLRPELVEDARRIYETFDDDLVEDPSLRQGLAASLARVSELYGQLGRSDAAEESATRALRMLETLHDATAVPAPAILAIRGSATSALAAARSSLGHRTEAAPLFAQAVDDLEAAREAEPTRTRALELSDALVNQGVHLAGLDMDAALFALDRAMELRGAPPDDPEERIEYERQHVRRARVVADTGDLAGADAELRRAIETLEPLAQRAVVQRDLAIAYELHSSVLRRLGQLPEAIEAQAAAVAAHRANLSLSPRAAGRRHDLAIALTNLSVVELETGRVDEARASCDEAITSLDALVAEHPSEQPFQVSLTQALMTLGRTLNAADSPDLAQAREVFERAAELTSDRASQDPLDGRRRLLQAWARFGRALSSDQARDVEALDEATAALELELAELVADHPTWVRAHLLYVTALSNRVFADVRSGRIMESCDTARRGMVAADEALTVSPDHAQLRAMRLELQVHVTAVEVSLSGDLDAATEAAESWVEAWPDGIPAHLEAAGFYAICADGHEDPAEAELWTARALDLVAAALDLGFAPPPDWPAQGTPLVRLRDHPQLRALIDRR